MFINHSSKQVTAKIVYYGPGLSGKTTNLKYIFSVTNPKSRGELVSIETDIERTLFFDLLPINVGSLNGYNAKFQLYTVPGQVFYDSTRRLVLKGADGIVFVADSQELMESANAESIENLKENLAFQNQNYEEIPMVFQYNKRDLANTSPIDKLNEQLNQYHRPYFKATATEGEGVIETLREISSLTLKRIKGKLEHSLESENILPKVRFDVDKDKEIIPKEEIPVTTISTETIEVSTPPENGLLDLQGFEQVEKQEADKDEDDNDVTQDFIQPKDIPEAKEIDDTPTPKKIKKIKKSVGLKDLDDILKPQTNDKKIPKDKSDKETFSALSMLDNLKDNTRLTIIKKLDKLPENDSQLLVEVKNKDSLIVEPFEVKITPGIKKITIILDI
jgi:signal recognition particle receptor subunit beta